MIGNDSKAIVNNFAEIGRRLEVLERKGDPAAPLGEFKASDYVAAAAVVVPRPSGPLITMSAKATHPDLLKRLLVHEAGRIREGTMKFMGTHGAKTTP